MLSELLAGWGAEIEIQEVGSGRPNLIACFEGRSTSQSLMLEAHSDTVAVEAMSIPPFDPQIEEGKLSGRGACDTKGSMAAMLLAIRSILDSEGRPPSTLYFVSTCDEELGATGAHHLIKGGFRPNAAIVGEPTELSIVHATKGALRWKVRTHGAAGHSSDPRSGVNAIYRMTRVLELLEGTVSRSLQEKEHPLLGRPTLSVGTIHGGHQANVIPDLCEIEVDRRVLPGEKRDLLTRELAIEISLARAGNEEIAFDLEETEWYPPFEENPSGPLSKILVAACEKVLGSYSHETAPWASNAGVFKEAGIPCLLFGPGSIRQAHTKDEFIDLAEVVQAARVYAEVIRGFGS
jgi:acetylornithine deacetylase